MKGGETKGSAQGETKGGDLKGSAQGETKGGDMKGSAEGDTKGSRGPGAGGEMKSGRAAASVNLNTEQRTTIREKIVTSSVDKVTVNFNVAVGTVVPRTVRIHTLPVEIVRLVPEFEGYSYIVLADGRIVIIEPATYEIVTVISV
jgi:hypothetical protein